MLSASQQAEMVNVFSDPSLLDGTESDSQAQAKYPGLQIANDVPTPVSTENPSSGNSSDAKTYSVHSYYHHTDTLLFLSNTASLDYYYTTDSGKVLSDSRCTWHDSGPTLNSINNVATNKWISGGNGHCYADVQISSIPYGVDNNYLDQDMDVNYHGIYHKHFYESDN